MNQNPKPEPSSRPPSPPSPAAVPEVLPPPDPTSSWGMCFVCGPGNQAGLHLKFRREGEDVIATDFIGSEERQGWPGVVHGGIIASVLDETLSRAAALTGRWTMTAKLELRYRRPLAVGVPATCRASLIGKGGRTVSARGQVLLQDGTVVAEAEALMVAVPAGIMAEAARAFAADPNPETVPKPGR